MTASPIVFRPFTERQRAIAVAAAHGLSNRAIAAVFGISINTVEAHIGRILDKTNCVNRQALAGWLARRGGRE